MPEDDEEKKKDIEREKLEIEKEKIRMQKEQIARAEAERRGLIARAGKEKREKEEAEEKARESKEKEERRIAGRGGINLDDPRVMMKVLFGIILTVLGLIIGFFANPLFGIIPLALAFVITRGVPNFIPFVFIGVGGIVMSLAGPIIGFIVILIAAATSLFTFPAPSYNIIRIIMGVAGTGAAIGFSVVAFGLPASLLGWMVVLTPLGVIFAGYIGGCTDLFKNKPGAKMGVSMLGFVPLIVAGAIWLFFTGGVLFGNLGDLVQHNLKQGLGFGSGGLFDMIMDPKLATQMFMKPPTVSGEGGGPTIVPVPTVSFTASSQVVPSAGCYDTSTFQVIARVKNTGSTEIKDIDITLNPEPVLDPTNPCDNTDLWPPEDRGGLCEWSSSIPPGSTRSETCLASVPAPIKLPDIEIAESHTCFIDIIAETGYHSVARLPVQVIQSDYARSQYDQGKLQQAVVPTTVGQGPIELSMGGFEQPIWDSTSTVTLIVSLSNNGNGEVGSYESMFLYIPEELIDESKDPETYCGEGSAFTCFAPGTSESTMTGYDDSEVSDYAANFLTRYKENGEIGGFEQVTYDDSYEALKSTHYLCFYDKKLEPESLMTMAVCTLSLDFDIIEADKDTRKTFIIRGDVLYTYEVMGDALITVRDCEVGG